MTDPTARALMSRMADELDHYRQLLTDSRHESHAFAVEARAYLAQSEPQGENPDTDQILSLAAIIREVDGKNRKGAAALAEAILGHPDARWGRPVAPPAEGVELTDQELDAICIATPWHGSPRLFGREVARAAIAVDRGRWGRPANAPAHHYGDD